MRLTSQFYARFLPPGARSNEGLVRPRMLYASTLFVWAAAVGVDAVRYAASAFELLPTDEVYATSVSFQLIAFGLTRGLYWIMGLLVVLLLEMALFGRKQSRHQRPALPGCFLGVLRSRRVQRHIAVHQRNLPPPANH